MNKEVTEFINFCLIPGHPRTSAARFLLVAALVAPEKFVVQSHLRNVAAAVNLPKTNIHKQAQRLLRQLGLEPAWKNQGAKYRLVPL